MKKDQGIPSIHGITFSCCNLWDSEWLAVFDHFSPSSPVDSLKWSGHGYGSKFKTKGPQSFVISWYLYHPFVGNYHQLHFNYHFILTSITHKISHGYYHQLPSITINYHQLPSITINYHQLPSITINYHQLPSITINYLSTSRFFHLVIFLTSVPGKSPLKLRWKIGLLVIASLGPKTQLLKPMISGRWPEKNHGRDSNILLIAIEYVLIAIEYMYFHMLKKFE